MALRSSLAQLRRWVGLVFAVVPILFAANGAHNQFEVNRVHTQIECTIKGCHVVAGSVTAGSLVTLVTKVTNETSRG